MRTLGHYLDDDDSVKSCAQHAIAGMTRVFYGNLSPGLLKSSEVAKMKFLKTCLCSIPRCRWSRWPFTQTLANKLDACQRRFLYSLFPVKLFCDEMLPAFYARRHRTASHLACATGRWSDLWARDVCKWHSHVQRRHDPHAWNPHLLSWRSGARLALQKLWHSSLGESRTSTRMFPGKPYCRWEEGLQLARCRL